VRAPELLPNDRIKGQTIPTSRSLIFIGKVVNVQNFQT